MLPDFDKIRMVVGTKENLSRIVELPVFETGSAKVLSFLSDLSSSILKDATLRQYPEIMAYAYWIRKSNLVRETESIQYRANRMGRGIAFHIAPSNIPIQFAISMVPALMAGNACVIRISSKHYIQTEILCEKIADILTSKHPELIPYINIIQYEQNDDITQYFSEICDVRIIWGGDETVRRIRKYPISPRTVELTFADRYSIAIINSECVDESNVHQLVNDFWLDTYYIDQNACSSPRLIAWLGKDTSKVRDMFWDMLREKVCNEYHIESVQVINKFSKMVNCTMDIDGVKVCEHSGALTRIEVPSADAKVLQYKEGGGYFFEYMCESLNELLPILNEKHCQTVAVFGEKISKVKEIVFSNGVKGVDRIVSIGKTTYPGLKWDGYSMIETMSRYVEFEGGIGC